MENRSYLDDDIENLGPDLNPRHRIKTIDWAQADKIAALGPTKEILADYLGVSPQILDLRCKKDLGCTALEYIGQKMAPTKMRLLSVAIEEAIKKRNPTMMIFMLKNLCGFTDKREVKQEVSATQSQVSIVLPTQVQERVDALKTVAPKTIEAHLVKKKKPGRPKKPQELTRVNVREEEAVAEREAIKGQNYEQAVFTPEQEAAALGRMEKFDEKLAQQKSEAEKVE